MATVSRVIAARPTPEGAGMTVWRAMPTEALGRLDPFLVFDEMGPEDVPAASKAGFPDHPHRGFETVTYILEGEIEHRDSQGHRGVIGSGGIQWMTAGAGVVHSEMPGPTIRKQGGRLHGFQLWVNLPAAQKMRPPRYQERTGPDIPEADVPGGKVRVIAGRHGDKEAVVDTHTPIQYLHAVLDPNAKLTLDVPLGHQGFVFVEAGGGQAGGKDVGTRDMGILSGEGPLDIKAGPDGLGLLLITGKPIGEPVFQWGPFVMTNRLEILQAVRDFEAGKFGTIPAEVA